MKTDDSLIRKIRLGDELDSSIKQIIAGLKELQTEFDDISYYFIAVQLISSGFERLLKCSFCYWYFNNHRDFPSKNELKKYGHNISSLFEEFIKSCFTNNTETKKDYLFLIKDPEARHLIEMLSYFGDQGR